MGALILNALIDLDYHWIKTGPYFICLMALMLDKQNYCLGMNKVSKVDKSRWKTFCNVIPECVLVY